MVILIVGGVGFVLFNKQKLQQQAVSYFQVAALTPLPSSSYGFSVGTYHMSIPDEWKLTENSDNNYEITDVKTKKSIGTLGCPIPTMGFESWNFKGEGRSYVAKGATYKVSLSIGTHAEPDTDTLILIFMAKDPDTLGLGENPDSCSVMIRGGENAENARKIYNSIEYTGVNNTFPVSVP